MPLDDTTRRRLLELAEASIAHGLRTDRAPELDELPAADTLPDVERATFVSVYLDGQLNGCMGRLQASRRLVEGVASNAYMAAFRDPRFEAPPSDALDRLHVEISVLSPLERLPVERQEQIFDYITPGRHGLVLERGDKRGTFLPSVWEKCPDPAVFLVHLKKKAGLPLEEWSADIDVYRYEVDDFSSAPL